MQTTEKSGLKRLTQKCISLCLTVFLLGAVAMANEVPDSPSPILISEAESTRALAVNAEEWKGSLPEYNTESFQPGAESRAVIFVTNLALMDGEGPNALRVYAEDRNGKSYRLAVEDIKPLSGQEWIYGVTVRLYDDNGYNGQPAADGDVLFRLTWRGMTSNRVRVGFGYAGGKTKDDEGAVPTPAPKSPEYGNDFAYNNEGDRRRFMEQGAFGPSAALDLRLRRVGIQRWVNEQIGMPYPGTPYPDLPLKPNDQALGCPDDPNTNFDDVCRRDHYSEYQLQKWMFTEALYGDDQLRRRVSWAMHQIWVVSGLQTDQARWQLEYIKILDRNAFGNYRTLMSEMTLNPAMGNYLDMMRSTRRNPNENYPREILQLFSIGLDELNLDGTPKIVGGNRIPTYDQDKIVQFTKVFTGWARCEAGPPACPNDIPNGDNYIDPMVLNIGVTDPTPANPGNHDISAKSLFNYPGAPNATIPACTNCTNGPDPTTELNNIRAYANNSLNQTLDNIYNHPNVAPFIGKLLIQHLVTSDPSPAYVARVATVFNNNRTSPNQMGEVVKAILLDPEARGGVKNAPDYGKLREPFQLATNFYRQFNVRASGPVTIGGVPTPPPASCNNRSDGVLNGQTNAMAQSIWNPPSVFNYYSPEYVIPGTDLIGPEFNILDTGTSFRRINFINAYVYGQTNFQQETATFRPDVPCGTSIDIAEAQAWAAADPTGAMLIDGLNRKMLQGRMTTAMRNQIGTAVVAIPNTGANAARDRARQAIYLVATSSQYQVQR